jgi:hypothetical protein
MAESAFDSNAIVPSSAGVGLWVFVGIAISIILLLHHFYKKRCKSDKMQESSLEHCK